MQDDKKIHFNVINNINEDKTLIGYELQIPEKDKESKFNNKKAIIYMSGGDLSIHDSIPAAFDILQNVQKRLDENNVSTKLVCFYQHYRGRGVNKNNKDHFIDYSMIQDMKDQSCY